MDKDTLSRLINSAISARDNAYAPYSGFSVGAAVLTDDGEIITGSNIENISYPAGLCAERVAMFSAAAKGYRSFAAIAVSGGKAGEEPADYCMPCGMCLQVMSEFCRPDCPIYIVRTADDVKELRLADLLPHAFSSLKN